MKTKLAMSSKLASQKRIESPLAKYNSIGQLTCIICNLVVKSENLWNTHLNSKIHLENKTKLKTQLTKAPTPSTKAKGADSAENTKNVFKRPASEDTPAAKSSGSVSSPSIVDANAKKQKLDAVVDKKANTSSAPPETKMDTNDTVTNVDVVDHAKTQPDVKINPLLETAPSTALPEGFFDDPDMDDKVRGVSRAENLEAEYEEFKKIMQTEEHKSDQIIEQDDIIRDVDRELEEVDELIGRWSKIEDLHNKREAILAANKKKSAGITKGQIVNHESDSDDDGSDIDLDSVLHLEIRNKKFF